MAPPVRRMCLACNREYENGETNCPDDNTALITLSRDPLVGRTIAGRWQIEDVIGVGAYRVVHQDTPYTLRLHKLHAWADAAATEGWRRRVEAVKALEYPSIVRLYDCGIMSPTEGFAVSDYVEDAIALPERLKKSGKLSVKEAYSIFADVCDALDYAHGRSVLHCDLAPEQIVLASAGARLQGFDCFRTSITSQSQTMCQEIGADWRAAYVNPEQCQHSLLGPASDLYSLACVLYETLTGRTPFRGSNSLQTAMMHVSNAMPVLGNHELDAFFAVALAKSRDIRFNKASEFKDALSKLVG